MANVVDAVRLAVASRAPCSSNSSTLVSAALSRYRSRRDLSFVPTSSKLPKFQPVRGAFRPANRRRAPSLRRIVCEAQDTVAQVQNINEKTFKSVVLESDMPVLVDFWAPWCGPCRMIEPLIDELAKQYSGKIKCVKVNTDESPNIATEYGIRSIPTVMIFKDGQKKDTVIGAVPKTTLCTCIEKFVEW